MRDGTAIIRRPLETLNTCRGKGGARIPRKPWIFILPPIDNPLQGDSDRGAWRLDQSFPPGAR